MGQPELAEFDYPFTTEEAVDLNASVQMIADWYEERGFVNLPRMMRYCGGRNFIASIRDWLKHIDKYGAERAERNAGQEYYSWNGRNSWMLEPVHSFWEA